MNISVLVVSFKSGHLLKRLIKSIPQEYEILIIENSLDEEIKEVIEKDFSNTKVIIPENNLGYAKATNLGLSLVKNDFVWLMTPDIEFTNQMIKKFEILINKFSDFALIAPTYSNTEIYKNYYISSNKKKEKIFETNVLQEVDNIDWCLCLLNKKEFDKTKILDENFFLYFETMDLSCRLIKMKKKMYVVNNMKFNHIGTSSSKKDFKQEITINRNWHFCWSKFYYFKKNFGYFYALKKIMPNLIRSIKKIIIGKIFNKKENFEHGKAELSGSLNSIFLRKSYYRPKIKN